MERKIEGSIIRMEMKRRGRGVDRWDVDLEGWRGERRLGDDGR